jgi:DNA-binding transcriptional LysR family regulator
LVVLHDATLHRLRGGALIDKLSTAIDCVNTLRMAISMNIHHLELFYYVARHGGVSAAARRIPYGIQQPAISAQVIQLEDNLGTPLFHRRPFQLTPAGEELFRFIEPFFGGLDEVGRRIRGEAQVRLRIGAPETVQREYLPGLLQTLRARQPGLSFTLFSGRLSQIEARLLAQEIDLGIAPLEGKRPMGIQQRELIQLSMFLLVPKSSKLRSAEELWKRDRLHEPLISMPSDEPTCRRFQQELQKRKVEWFPGLELNSQELIARYVSEGFGIGLVLLPPRAKTPAGTRVLELTDFPKVSYGALWLGTLSPLQQMVLEEMQKIAESMTAGSDTSS